MALPNDPLSWLANGEPVREDVLNRPLQELLENDQYLEGLINGLESVVPEVELLRSLVIGWNIRDSQELSGTHSITVSSSSTFRAELPGSYIDFKLDTVDKQGLGLAFVDVWGYPDPSSSSSALDFHIRMIIVASSGVVRAVVSQESMGKYVDDINAYVRVDQSLSQKIVGVEIDKVLAYGATVLSSDITYRFKWEARVYVLAPNDIPDSALVSIQSYDASMSGDTVNVSPNRAVVYKDGKLFRSGDGDLFEWSFNGFIRRTALLSTSDYGALFRTKSVDEVSCEAGDADAFIDGTFTIRDNGVYLSGRHDNGYCYNGNPYIATGSHTSRLFRLLGSDYLNILESNFNFETYQSGGIYADSGSFYISANMADLSTTRVTIKATADQTYLGNSSNPWTDIYYENLHSTSDARLKELINQDVPGIDLLDKVEVKAFRYKNRKSGEAKGPVRFGLLAQDLLEALGDSSPDALVEESDDGYYFVDTNSLLGIAIKAIKDLSAKVKELEAKLAGGTEGGAS